MNLIELLQFAAQEKASDIFIVAGRPFSYKVNGKLFSMGEALKPADTEELVKEIYHLDKDRPMDDFLKKGDNDFSLTISGLARFRVCTYLQRGSMAAVIRLISFVLPDPVELCIPETVLRQAMIPKGLVLVTGSAGSGKSTTLACMVDRINTEREYHIITLEDPLEYLHRHKKSIVSQREVGSDTRDYLIALRAALRQSPDVILLGEMRDFETIQTAMTAAETGHLVLSSLHTVGAANTINRIIDVFDPSQQRQIAVQLSMVLKAVISQQLVPTVDGGMAPVFEIMTMNPAISTMIRDNRIHQIDGTIQTGGKDGMVSMDASLAALYKAGKITKETAMTYCLNTDSMMKQLR